LTLNLLFNKSYGDILTKINVALTLTPSSQN